MDYLIGLIVLTVIIFIVLSIIRNYLPIRTFNGVIIDKQKETWKSMSVSNKVTSYSLIVQTNTFDQLTLIVLNARKFEDLVIGDYGTIKVRGIFLIDFSKVTSPD